MLTTVHSLTKISPLIRKEIFKNFDMATYSKTTFGMYSGPRIPQPDRPAAVRVSPTVATMAAVRIIG